MNQLYLRKAHKTAGLISALFILLQAGSGLLLSLKQFYVPHSHAYAEPVNIGHEHENEQDADMQEKHKEDPVTDQHVQETGVAKWQSVSQNIHHGGGFFGSIYRILLATCLIFIALSGSAIFCLTRKMIKK